MDSSPNSSVPIKMRELAFLKTHFPRFFCTYRHVSAWSRSAHCERESALLPSSWDEGEGYDQRENTFSNCIGLVALPQVLPLNPPPPR